MDMPRDAAAGPCAHHAAVLRLATARGVVPLARTAPDAAGGPARIPGVPVEPAPAQPAPPAQPTVRARRPHGLRTTGGARIGRSRRTDEWRVALTPREIEVLALVGRGWSDGAIASHLFISKKTASVHVANIKGKLGTQNRVETALAALALDLGAPAA